MEREPIIVSNSGSSTAQLVEDGADLRTDYALHGHADMRAS